VKMVNELFGTGGKKAGKTAKGKKTGK